jgi:rubrerythrin
MSFKSFEEIILFAIEKEKEAAEFYERLAEQDTPKHLKDTLLGFSKEEKKHQNTLEDVLNKKEKIASYQFKWIPDLKRSNYLVDVEYHKGMGYTDLLRLAMKREEVSLKLYNELMNQIENQDLLKVFKMLAQEEAGHKLKLESIYDDFMAKQGD